jgi:large subunit ribosomal protein L31
MRLRFCGEGVESAIHFFLAAAAANDNGGGGAKMKQAIHPEYYQVNAACSCGNALIVGTARAGDLSLEICAKCHPFYTGKQKLVDTSGRVEKFRNRYGGGGE